jgi:predicted nucleic acid-binding Zn ribbon protein
MRTIAPIDDLSWLALLGSAADLGTSVRLGALADWRRQHRTKDVAESIALLNAARRSAEHDVATALRVLRAAVRRARSRPAPRRITRSCARTALESPQRSRASLARHQFCTEMSP